MIYSFDPSPFRRNTNSEKWDTYPEDVLPLWVADMDFVSPEPVVRALRERVEHGVFGYTRGASELREIIVARMAEWHGWAIQPEMIVFLPGVIVGFNLACHMLAEPGGRVLFQTPVYKPFFGAPGYAGMIRQPVELSQMSNGRYGVDQAQFESAFTPQTQMFLLCNPHNPVGRVFHQDELERMAETCLRREIIICSDEIHADLIYPGHRHIPIASLAPEIARRTITLMAPSKTFNIPGLECAFAIIPDAELRRKYRHAQQGLVPGVNLLGQTAALAAYRDGGEWLSQIRGYLQANRDFLVDFVAAELPEIHLFPPEGTYLAWLDCQALKVSPNPYEFFLQKARVALSEGNTFGRGGEGFLRLNFGCTRPTLAQALERMKTALQEAR